MEDWSKDRIADCAHRVVFVVGSTASGKSARALAWAQKWGGVLVNCDSIQCYQGLRIGSALPSEYEQSLVPHHLYSYVPEGELSTAGQYSRDFFSLLRGFKKPTLFWVVGGTGFYFQALEKGMYPVRHIKLDIKEEVARQIAEPGGVEKLYAELQDRDPVAAQKISIHDEYRIGRAIELMRSEGLTLSEIQKKFEESATPFPYPLFKLGLRRSKEELRQRITDRTRKMIQEGLVDEVQGLLKRGRRDWAPLASVGYKETVEMIEKNLDVSWLQKEIDLHTLRLTKKQKTWFQRDTQIHWVEDKERVADSDLDPIEGWNDFIQGLLKEK